MLVKGGSDYVLNEVHVGVRVAHQEGPTLANEIKRLGYSRPTMVQDAIKFVKTCQACQIHEDFSHRPPQLPHPSILSWPFHAWGLDVIGPFQPSSSRGHVFILAATHYFSKWAEAIPLREVGAK